MLFLFVLQFHDESKQFWGTFIGKSFSKWTLSEKHRKALSLKTTVCEDIIFI